jgi:hypothetical protein
VRDGVSNYRKTPLRRRKFKEIRHECVPSWLLDSRPAILPETAFSERCSLEKGQCKKMYPTDTSRIETPLVDKSNETEMAGSYLCRLKHYKQLPR